MTSPVTFELHASGKADCVHHYDPGEAIWIESTGNRIRGHLGDRSIDISLPLPFTRKLAGLSRLARRALRLDKMNVVVNHGRDGLVILYLGTIYFYDLATDALRVTGKLRQSRNALHQAVAVSDEMILFGEYGSNADRAPVPIWRSLDDGRSFNIVHEIGAGKARHVHGIYADPFEGGFWVATGDFRGECHLHRTQGGFDDLVVYGDGTQRWRPVSLFFTPTELVWAMDSPLEPNHLQRFDRATGTLLEGRQFEGPVWYSKTLSDGWHVLQTSVEIGPGVIGDEAIIYASHDLEHWEAIARYTKDRLPMRYFKFGVIAFTDGVQSSDDFCFFGEALQGLDGRYVRGAIRHG